ASTLPPPSPPTTGGKRCVASASPTSTPSAAEFFRPQLGGLDRVQEGGADPLLLEDPDRGDRRPARRGHRLPELDGVPSGVAEHLGAAEHRLDDQLGGDVPGEAE